VLAAVVPALSRLDYDPVEYSDDELQGSSRLRRENSGNEGSGNFEDYGPEDDDEDQEYYSSTEILPSRQPGLFFILICIVGSIN
jgi:hypothetical protein